MQTSLKWVNEFVNIETVNLDYLIEKLTLGGFEVEEILEFDINGQKEIAVDISATANRSDSLSIEGISKEVALLLNKPFRVTNYSIEDYQWKEAIEHESSTIQNIQDCSTFITMTVENLSNVTVPQWLKHKLLSSGITPSNNLLDFQNYILLETGYPFEFYDLDKISSKLKTSNFNLTIETSQNQELFSANNGIDYSLNNSILLLKANSIPISIGGIIPQKDFCYSDQTISLLIEGSIFNSTTVRQQSRILGLRTDRSARYEKSLKEIHLLESFYKLISLLRISNPNLICKLHTINQSAKQNFEPILLKYKTVKEILGPVKQYRTNDTYITPKLITNYLTRLNFNYKYDDSKITWEVDIPCSRNDDITREIDLIEEIGRIHGFNNFLSRLPKIRTIGNEDYSYQTRKKITSCLLNLGFTELIHYSLVKERTFVPNKIKLINPLTADYSNLRSTLLPNLIHTVENNLKQGNQLIEGFEFGHVFSSTSSQNFEEIENIAGIFGGTNARVTWSSASTSLNWFEAKGKFEQFFNQLNIKPQWECYSLSAENEMFHPYCTAKLYLDSKNEIGIFGQIHPILAKKLNIPLNLYLFELNFERIQKQIQTNKLKLYQEYSSYPKIVKDLSFIIHKDISFQMIKNFVYLNGTQFLSNISLVDEYKGKSIPENHISLCLQLTFQSNEKTLQNKEIEVTIQSLQSLLTDKLNATIRK
jgi:phenylalanyl-tRNA synthetase beta chain